MNSKLRVTGKYSGQRARKLIDARPHSGLHGRPESVSLHHELCGDGQLHAEPDDVHRGHVRVHPQRAGGRKRKRRPGQRDGEPPQCGWRTGQLPVALPGRRCCRPALLRATRSWRTSTRYSGTASRSTCRRSSPGAAASAPRRRTSAILAGSTSTGRRTIAVSLTKVTGRHTIKTGVYNNHSFKAQNTGAGGLANLQLPGLRQLRQRHEQPDRHGLRLRQRRDGRVHAVPPG